MDKPLVSIIIPSFNRQNLIGETLDSVLAQTYQNWECIVVDDGSTDNTIEVVDFYASRDSRIKCYQRDREPKGGSVCRNIGLNISEGEYIIFLDSDDLLHNTCLESRIYKFNLYPTKDFLIFQSKDFYVKIGDNNTIWNIDKEEEDLIRFLRFDIVWSISGPIWKKDALMKINGFTDYLRSWQDWEIHVRALSNGLSYKKFFNENPDVYIRREREHSVGIESMSLAHHGAHSRFVENLINYPILKSEKYREILLGIIYMLLIRWINYKNRNRGCILILKTIKIFNIKHIITFFLTALLYGQRGGKWSVLLNKKLLSDVILNVIDQKTHHKVQNE